MSARLKELTPGVVVSGVVPGRDVTAVAKRVWDRGSEAEATTLARQVGGLGEAAKDLAYRLYSICDRRGWSEDALGFNALVTAWPEITRQAQISVPIQPELEQ